MLGVGPENYLKEEEHGRHVGETSPLHSLTPHGGFECYGLGFVNYPDSFPSLAFPLRIMPVNQAHLKRRAPDGLRSAQRGPSRLCRPLPPRMSTLAQTNATWSANVEVCFQPNRRGAQKSLAALQDRAMVKRTAPIRVISFFLLAACGALCQSERPSADLLQGLQFDGSNSPEVQRQEMRTWRSLPDAPSSVQPPTQAEKFHTFVNEARSPLTLGAVGVNAGVMRETELEHVTPGPQPSLTALYKAVFIQKESSAFFGKYLYPSLLKQDPRYYPSTSGSFMGRATYAASRIFITRDDSGKRRLNTSYFLGVLTSVAIHTAYRPYWARSTSATFNNFGSTIGSDAGINLFHEFGPGIRQMVKGHTPKFVSRIEEGITHDQTPRDLVSTPCKIMSCRSVHIATDWGSRLRGTPFSVRRRPTVLDDWSANRKPCR